MKKFKTTELQDQLTRRLAATEMTAGRTFAGSWWGRGDTAERFYFAESATIRANGKPIHGIKVWLQFDDPATLDGVALRVQAPKRWYETTLADWHAEAVNIAVELVDPDEANRLRREIAAARKAGEQIGDLVSGDDD